VTGRGGVAGDDVGGVGLAAAGHADVQGLPGQRVGDEEVGGVDGAALGDVDVSGVGELGAEREVGPGDPEGPGPGTPRRRPTRSRPLVAPPPGPARLQTCMQTMAARP